MMKQQHQALTREEFIQRLCDEINDIQEEIGIKDLIRQGDVQGVAVYLAQNLMPTEELSELRTLAEGVGKIEVLSFLDSALVSNGRKDSGSSGNSSTISSNIPGVNYDIEKAYEYLEKLEKKYTEEQIEKIHQNVKFLMNKTLGANKFAKGFKDAMDDAMIEKQHSQDDCKLAGALHDLE